MTEGYFPPWRQLLLDECRELFIPCAELMPCRIGCFELMSLTPVTDRADKPLLYGEAIVQSFRTAIDLPTVLPFQE